MVLHVINEHMKSGEQLGHCAAISECRAYDGTQFFVANLYLTPGAKNLKPSVVAKWFTDAGCVNPVINETIFDERNGMVDGLLNGMRAWEVSYRLASPLHDPSPASCDQKI